MHADKRQIVWEQLKRFMDESEYILVGIGEEWESESPDISLKEAYEKLKLLVGDKDYFLVTTAFDGLIHDMGFAEERLVAPCGDRSRLQCSAACTDQLWRRGEEPSDGLCPHCRAPLTANTIETKPYVEAGYLPQWEIYMGWLQKSVNRKLFILELGVGFRTPTVIRWPFEKTAYLNQKSSFCRVHEKLSQLPDNLGGRGISVAENSVDWLINGTIF